jgi:miniconductance mechanosensitive channel
MVFLCWLSNFAAKKIISHAVYKIVKKSQTQWDDVFYENRVFSAFSHIAPALVIMIFAGQFPFWREFLNKSALVYMALIGYITAERIIESVDCIYKTYEMSKEKPITSYLQVLKLFAVAVCLILTVGVIVDKSPWTLLSGIGALTAVLLVIFKDSIMGLSAGIQLSVNKMLHIGDWIEMPKYGADGEVIEITLNTVKVQNWDKTLIMIPVYCLISESFKNWRGMYTSGGRRIKRAIYIDVSSVSFCGPDIIDGLRKNKMTGPRLEVFLNKISKKDDTVSGVSPAADQSAFGSTDFEGLTNAGVFRNYIVEFLRSHPLVDKTMPVTARQLHPCEYGLPIEIYAFCGKTEWLVYENAQAGIIEHFIAIAHEFGLKIFQRPAGADMKKSDHN